MTRYIPEGYVVTEHPELDAIVGVGGLQAIGYSGRSKQCDFHYKFNDKAQLDEYISKYLDGLRTYQLRVEKASKARKEYRHDYKVGDILYAGGWDQHAVTFFEVVNIPSDKTIEVRKIKSVESATQSGQFIATPSKGVYVSKTFKKTVFLGGYIKSAGNLRAYRWKGQPVSYEKAI